MVHEQSGGVLKVRQRIKKKKKDKKKDFVFLCFRVRQRVQVAMQVLVHTNIRHIGAGRDTSDVAQQYLV